jgi:putative tricarboxylic transport membrane protein
MHGITTAFGQLLSPLPFSLMLLGTALGIVVGAVPGLTGAMLISLTLPLTFALLPGDALVLLVAMYVGSISGGLISATLLRIPGTPASLMTTLDGYPMAQKGQPGRALGLGISASLVGGLVSWVCLVLLARPMADLSTRLGYFDYFSLVLMALVLIASVSGESLLRGLFAGLLGILASMPGTNPSTGELRLTFGFAELNDGFKLLPVLIGLFAVSQAFRDLAEGDREVSAVAAPLAGIFLSLRDWLRHGVNLLRSSVIGTWVGILPGVGANVGSILAYSVARNFSKAPEAFGHGSEEGIIASEAANNATVGGALIPLVALGIPGSVIDAILLGGLVMHGLQPGPLLFQNNPDIVYLIMATALAANVCMGVLMVAAVKPLAALARVPRTALVPVILVFCVVGAFSLSNRMFDVWVMLGFGVVGLLLEKGRVPLAPFVIGLVLAPVAEENLGAALLSSGGSWWPLFTRPLSLLFLVLAACLFAWPLWRRWRKGSGEKRPVEGKP